MASHFSLPVVLTQLRPGLNVADYEHVGIDPRCGLLLLLRADGDLFASKLESPTDDGHFAKKILSKVRRFALLDESATSENVEKCVRFAVLAHDRSLALWDLDADAADLEDAESLRCVQKITSKDMKFQMKRKYIESPFKTIDMIGCFHSGTSLLVDSKIVAVFFLSASSSVLKACVRLDQPLTWINDDASTADGTSPVEICCRGSLMFALTNAGVVIMYHLERNAPVGVYNVKEYLAKEKGVSFLEDETFLRLSVDFSLTRLAVSTSLNRVYLISIEEYFRLHPTHLNSSLWSESVADRRFDYVDDDEWNEDDDDQTTNSKIMGDVWFRREMESIRKATTNLSSTAVINIARVESKSSSSSSSSSSRIRDVLKNLSRSTQSRQLDRDSNETFAALFRAIAFGSSSSSKTTTTTTSSDVLDDRRSVVAWHVTADFSDVETGFVVEEVFLDATALIVFVAPLSRRQLFKNDDEDESLCGFLYVRDFKSSGPGVKHTFGEPTVLAQIPLHKLPLCIVNNRSVSAWAVGISQEALVNKVILFSNAKLAETLCRLNHWDRYSLPLNALEKALGHRQLDTIAFFLHQGCRELASGEQASRAARIFRNAPQLPPLAPDQMEAAIRMLTRAVEENHWKQHQSQFPEQLLNVTLQFLRNLMQDQTAAGGDDASTADGEESKIPLDKLAEYLGKLRKFVPDRSVSPTERSVVKERTDMTQNWDNGDIDIIVRDGFLKNSLPVIQAWLLGQRREKEVSLDNLLAIGMKHVLQALLDWNVSVAKKLLEGMGCDVLVELERICFSTIYKPLRDFLALELLKSDCLSKADSELIEYICILERFYTVQDYEVARSLIEKRKESSTTGFFVPELFPSLRFKLSELLKARDILPFAAEDLLKSVKSSPEAPFQESYGYSQLMLSWFKGLDLEKRECVLLERFQQDSSHEKEIDQFVSVESKWAYYFARGDWKSLVDQIGVSLPSLDPHSVSAGEIAAALARNIDDDDNDANATRSLPSSVWKTLPLSPKFVAERVLDELACHGQFTGEELASFSLLLRRTARALTLISRYCHHPLALLSSQQQGGVPLLLAFHRNFLALCVEQRLVNVMYAYMDHYGLGLSCDEFNELAVPLTSEPWVDVLTKFRLVTCQPLNFQSVLDASLANARLLFNGVENACVSSMLELGRPLMAVATLMYAPGTIEDAMTPDERKELWSVDADVLKRALAPYPKLLAAVFPVQPPLHKSSAEKQDVTLYDLLKGAVPLKINQIFKWQSTNNLRHDITVHDPLADLPHFSHSFLVTKFSHEERLPFTYYLRHGRPSFAYATFVSHYFTDGVAGQKRTKAAASKASRMALRHFDQLSVTASCVAFVEMLGRDSCRLRVDIEAAIRLLECLDGRSSSGDSRVVVGTAIEEKDKENVYSSREAIVQDFLAVFVTNDVSVEERIVKRLETATRIKIKQEGLDRTSLAAADVWNLVLIYCRQHCLDLSTGYLIECAKVNSWLDFICHAEEHQFKIQQVLSVINTHFTNVDIQEHVRLALERISSSPEMLRKKPGGSSTPKTKRSKAEGAKRSKEKKEKETFAQPDADPRSRFYMRMGVKQKKHGKERSTEREEKKKEVQISPVVQRKDPASEPTSDFEDASDFDGGPVPLVANELPENLFDVLFACETHPEPWRALLAHAVALNRPLLAILASCYQQSVVLDCLYIWLWTTCGGDGGESSILWSHRLLEDLSDLLLVAARRRPTVAAAMKLAFFYFDTENILLYFLKFHEAFVLKIDLLASIEYLKEFVTRLDECVDELPGLIGNRQWIETICNEIAEIMLQKCTSNWQRNGLLRIFCDSQFGENFNTVVTDYSKLYSVFLIMEKAELDFGITEEDEEKKHWSEAVLSSHPKVLEKMIERRQFDLARDYSDALGLATDEIAMKEVSVELDEFRKSEMWDSVKSRSEFWLRCHTKLTSRRCSGEAGRNFFESLADSAYHLTTMERVRLFSLALHWQEKSGRSSTSDVEKKMWLATIDAFIEEGKNAALLSKEKRSWVSEKNRGDLLREGDTKSVLLSEEMERWSNTNLQEVDGEILHEDKRDAVTDIINSLLDCQELSDACRLSIYFGQSTADLERVISCLRLASGRTSFAELEPSVRHLLYKKMHKDDSVSPSTSAEPKAKRTAAALEQWALGYGEAGETVVFLNTLEKLCNHGKQCCSRAMTLYEIALLLRMPYESVLSQHPFDVLSRLLSSGMVHKYAKAKSFIDVSGLDKSNVAGFLADGIVKAMQVHYGEGSMSPGKSGVIYNPESSAEEFQKLASLCSDQSLLGNRLLEAAVTVGNANSPPTVSSLTTEVELMILSHDCHTIACNMEGISAVLRLSRKRTSAIASAGQYKLMIRLLDGIGRYREMSYVLDQLRRAHKFELLLSKRSFKQEKLKRALLEYLWRPEDREDKELVAHHLQMFRMMAILDKHQADSDLSDLHGVPMESSMKQRLSVIARGYTDAADKFSKEECLRNAQRCRAKAHLVLLQSKLLSSDIRVITLSDAEVKKLLNEHKHFHESLIIAQGYRMTSLATWIEPVYHQAVLNGNLNYFHDFNCTFPSANICGEVVAKYKRDSHRSTSASKNMRAFLDAIDKVHLKYRFAKELNFHDMVAALNAEEGDEFLSDVFSLGD